MKNFLAVIVLVSLCSCNFGQSQNRNLQQVTPRKENSSFKKVADELNALTDTYAGIYPYRQDIVLLKDYGLTYKDFPKDTEDHIYSESFSANKDSIDVFSLQEFYQQKIRRKLIELTSHKDFGKDNNEKLVNIFSTKSADNKVYNFAYDENTGGSYQSRISYIHYAGQKGDQDQSAYNSDGYDTIIPLKTKAATRYLMMGENIGCNSCMGHYTKVVHCEKGHPVVDFEYDLNTGMGYENAIEYNPVTKTLWVHYTTDDHTQYCYCNDGDKKEYTTKMTPVRQCSCTFIFNGSTFELIAQKDEPAKE